MTYIDPNNIIELVASHFNISKEEMESNRKRYNVTAKQISQSLIRTLCKNKIGTQKISLPTIAGFFNSNSKPGNMNHSTVIHSLKTVKNLIDTDWKFKKQYNDLLEECKKQFPEYTEETLKLEIEKTHDKLHELINLYKREFSLKNIKVVDDEVV